MRSKRNSGPCRALIFAALLVISPFLLFGCAPHLAEVKMDMANIRSGPGTGYPVAHMVESGDQLEIVEDLGEWYRVKMPREGYGWIYKPMVIVLQ